jgi:hypothetical protein
MKKIFLLLSLILPLCFYFTLPFQWLPDNVKKQHYKLFGLPAYQSTGSAKPNSNLEIEDKCPIDRKGWRKAQKVDGVEIKPSEACITDSPALIAAAVKGTNNVDPMVLMESRLTPDAIEKGKDLDGDGDPDEIHIRLEVAELNGGSPDIKEEVVSYDIAPGLKPGMWVFVPKSFGMSTENFESLKAHPLMRAPSPSIRVEQGDRVKVTLENAHYMPHTIHFHGVDHPFVDEQGEGNDGVPQTSELPLMPGKSRTYEMQPRQTGTMFYHCHVQPQVHIMMGLQGMFIIEENKPNNWLQTINVGAGHVRYPSVSSRKKFDSEYDLHYQSIDKDLNNLIKNNNDARLTTKAMHREYNITQATNDYYLVNGKAFPYTARESIIVTELDQKVKLRILNGSDEGIALHTHGHKFTETHADGVSIPEAAQITRDVGWIAPAQRADYLIETVDDGLHSYGEGIWLMHDHVEKTVTNNGIAPGGSGTAIVYRKYLSEGGFPLAMGVDWNKFFVAEYYKKQVPVWESYDELSSFGDLAENKQSAIRLILLMSIAVIWLFSITQVFKNE